MGTVTAIGEYDPNRHQPPNYIYSPATTSNVWTVSSGRASIAFDSWDVAIAAAIATARSFGGVKVNKVGGEWVVSWSAPVTYNPPYPQPYTVTWDGGLDTIIRTNGVTA